MEEKEEEEKAGLLSRSQFVRIHGRDHVAKPRARLEKSDMKDYAEYLKQCWCRLYSQKRRRRKDEVQTNFVSYLTDQSLEYLGCDLVVFCLFVCDSL